MLSHNRDLIMNKSKAQKFHNLSVAKHASGIGYGCISKLLNLPVSTIVAIVWKSPMHRTPCFLPHF